MPGATVPVACDLGELAAARSSGWCPEITDRIPSAEVVEWGSLVVWVVPLLSTV